MATGVHVLVPLKGLGAAKSRLADVFSRDERVRLVRAMLGDVVDAVSEAEGVAAVTLVSSDADAPRLARESGIDWWDDRALPWNVALAAAMRELVTAGRAAVVSADIPLVSSDELGELLARTPARGVAIARATDGGTNAVSMRPPAVLPTCFGTPQSAARHAAAARALGLDAVIVDRPGTALDLDTRSDVERFLELGRPTRTLDVLTRATAGTHA